MKLIGIIDAGTTSIKFVIYKTPDFEVICSHEVKVPLIIPKELWYEQDPLEVLKAVRETATVAIHTLLSRGFSKDDIAAIGITNQRETTICWNKTTGQPLYNAIVWKDCRTDDTIENILSRLNVDKNHFREISGLPISSLSSAIKIKWLRTHVPAVIAACRERNCYVGTMDTWLVWNLTNKEVFVTDVTNASRTQLMNIETLNYDPLLMKTFSVNPYMLPEIKSSSEIYGTVTDKSILDGLKISAILGNQQASLVGQMCFKSGQAKNTYRSGCFLLCNIGEKIVHSSHGLATTVAYKLGKDKPAIYALEGSIAIAGAALKWLKNNLGLMNNIYKDSEELGESVPTTGDVYFVPAFSGLYAPYWSNNARGVICGLTAYTTKAHIVRASLETVCYQTYDIIEAMKKDAAIQLSKLHVDGKMSKNNLLMQLQADISGIPILRAEHDTTSLGCAFAAAQAEGINLIDLKLGNRICSVKLHHETFLPTTVHDERIHRIGKWKKAVARSYGWIQPKKDAIMTEERYKLLGSLPFTLYLFSSFFMCAASELLKR